jgi:type I restriction enzyme S subunit
MKPLGEIVRILKGSKAPEVFDEPKPGAYPYLQIDDLRPDATPKYAIDKGGTLATKADVLIAWDGANAGTVGFDLEGYVGSTIAILRPTHDDIHAPYLGYFLRSKFNEIQENTTGATIPHVSRGYLESLRLPLPPLPEQRRIADLLSRTDRLRHLRRVGDTLSDSLLQSVFLEMFGDPRKNPMGWKVEKVGDHIKRIRYGTGSPPDYYEKGIAFIRATNVKQGSIKADGLAYISEEDAKKISKCRINAGDLIVVRSGVNSGDCALIPPEYDGAYAAYDLIVEVPYPTNLFINFLINSQFGKETIDTLSRRAGQPHVNSEQIESMEFPFPPLPEQEQFAAVVRRVESLRSRAGESKRQVEGLFQGLLHEAFRD